jgi:hypothetical protein
VKDGFYVVAIRIEQIGRVVVGVVGTDAWRTVATAFVRDTCLVETIYSPP